MAHFRKLSQLLLFSLSTGLIFLLILFFLRILEFLQVLLFEQIILSCLITLILVYVAPYTLRSRSKINLNSINNIHYRYIAVILVGLIFLGATSTILNIDRSRSFYILSWVDKRLVGENLRSINLSKVSSPEKLNSNGIEMRITEQIDRGMIIQRGNKLRLSFRGKITLSIANFLGNIYKLNGWKANNH